MGNDAGASGGKGRVRNQKPVNLEWGRYYSPMRTADGEYEKRVGCMSWEADDGHQGRFEIELYRVNTSDIEAGGDGEPEEKGELVIAMSCGGKLQFTRFSLTLISIHMKEKILETGWYYFTVTALGDGVNYEDSETARSLNWLYIRPKERLPEVFGAVWQWPSVRITNQVCSPYLRSYAVKVYYASFHSDTPQLVFADENLTADRTGVIVCRTLEEMSKRKGPGKYYFKVCAISSDISRCENGKWTELSGAYVKPE